MATEFQDNQHFAMFKGPGSYRTGNAFDVRWSEIVLASLRAAGIMDNMNDGTVPPDQTAYDFWLDKNHDPAILKAWDSENLAWMPVTYDSFFRLAAESSLDIYKTIIAGFANDVISQGNVPIYATAVGLSSLTIPDGINFIRTNGYYAADGKGAALYRLKPAPESDEPGQQISNAGAKRWGLAHRATGGRKEIDVLAYGIRAGEDVTAIARSIYSGLSNAKVIWPAGSFDLSDFIPVYGDFVETQGAGRRDTIFRQKTWGRPVFATADPANMSVRPVGVRFFDFGGEAWNSNVKCYFHDAFFAPGSAGPYICGADPSTTAGKVFLFRNGVLENPASITGLGTSSVTLTLSSPQGANDYILIKVTNKDDLQAATSLWISGVAQAASDSSLIFHGGGDDFVAERLHAEGFVCPVAFYGDWTSNAAGAQSRRPRIYDISFDNCDFLLFTEGRDGYVDRIIGGKISETQTDTGLTVGQAPVYKDPHVLYVTDRSTLATTENMRIGVLDGENRYSSNYKFRNCRGLTVEAGAALSFLRHLDIEGAENSFLHFPALGGAFNGHMDGQRAVFNLYGCQGVTISVDRLYLTSDITFLARFRRGYQVGGTGAQIVCSQCTIIIKDLFINASALRTNAWIVNHAGVDCRVIVENLYILNQMGGYFYFAREEEIATPVLTSQRGGMTIRNIYCANAIDLKLAALIGQNGGPNPNGMTVDVDIDAIRSGNLVPTTFDLRGTNHKALYRRSGAQVIPFTIRSNGGSIISYSNTVELAVAKIGVGQYRVTHNLGHDNYAASVIVERATVATRNVFVDNETATSFDVFVFDAANPQDSTVRGIIAAKAFGL